ncbi:MAG: tetratricopeptide repeat protein [Pyrinomonadaceae bacterium]
MMNKAFISTYRDALILAPAILFIIAQANNSQTLAQQRRRARATAAVSANSATPRVSASTRSLTISTEPLATIWLDEVQRGKTDQTGKLNLTKVSTGRHTLRVRAAGFSERSLPVLPAQRGLVAVKLTRTADKGELAFQEAEALREKARDDEARQAAKGAYQRAIALRPASLAAAHVGLARVLLDLNDYNGAMQEIAAARRVRPVYPEASAVEGRILREDADPTGAITAFRRSIREARGFQPEAHTGLARVYEDQARYADAAAEFRTAIAQLSDAEPALYQLLGAAYEKMEKYKEAVAAYEKYLQLAPEGTYASAIRSILDQLKIQAAEQAATP